MEKQELVSQLDNAQNNFMLGIAALGLLMQEDSYPALQRLTCILQGSSFSFVSNTSQVPNLYQNTEFLVRVAPFPLIEAANYIRDADDEKRQSVQEEFFKMLLRVLLKESFDVIKDYCKTSSQLDRFKQQDWYDFARILRNCLSHNFLVEYKNNSDKRDLPISWSGSEFTIEMEGEPLQMSFCYCPGLNHCVENEGMTPPGAMF